MLPILHDVVAARRVGTPHEEHRRLLVKGPLQPEADDFALVEDKGDRGLDPHMRVGIRGNRPPEQSTEGQQASSKAPEPDARDPPLE